MLEEFIVVVIRGVGLGALYALIAYAFNVCHNATGVLNFAQGSLMVTGGLLFTSFVSRDSGVLAWAVAVPIVGLVIGVVTAIQGAVVLKPLKEAGQQWSWMVTTLATSVIISALILLRRGPNATIAPNLLGDIPVLGTMMPSAYLTAFGLAIGLYLLLKLFYTKTMLGLGLNAMAQDLDAARATGIAVVPVQILAFGISGVILGLAGAALAPIVVLDPFSGIHYVVNGFIAAVIGGLGRDLGSLFGGVVLGVLSMLTSFYIGGQWQLTGSMAVLIIVLMVRPRGLFGFAPIRMV